VINSLTHWSSTNRSEDRRFTWNTTHCGSSTLWVKKLGHFYFYCNFGKCWSIFKILSMLESERNGS